MTETAAVDEQAPSTDQPIKRPPALRAPKAVQAVAFAWFRRSILTRAYKRNGRVVELRLPFFGPTVMVSDPALIRQIFMASTDDLTNVKPNLSRIFGRGSVFALDREPHRDRRKLLAPPFHGQSIKNYEKIIEEETLRESANWPQGREFRTLEPDEQDHAERDPPNRVRCRRRRARLPPQIVPPFAKLGSRLATLPEPPLRLARYGPWARSKEYRRNFDRTVFTLIDNAEADPHFDERTDILALMLRSRYEDGSAMSRQDVSDEMLTLVGAGHETTASTLGWAFERLRRHPDIVAKLVEEVDADGSELRQATILEVQRARTVIDFAGRHVSAPSFQLGEWNIPHGHNIVVSLADLHENPDLFPDPERFDPYRFVGNRPPAFAWMPFGGGTRRCLGAAFANTEMDVVLRTILRHFVIETDDARDEKMHFRGVAYTPKDGGRVVMHRRK